MADKPPKPQPNNLTGSGSLDKFSNDFRTKLRGKFKSDEISLEKSIIDALKEKLGELVSKNPSKASVILSSWINNLKIGNLKFSNLKNKKKEK